MSSRNEIEWASRYLDRQYAPIPVPIGSKAPALRNWQNLRLSQSQLGDYFAGVCNVGVLSGEPSHWLIDVDIDHEVAVRLAPDFLPATGMRHGRPGKPLSHWWYRVDGVRTEKFALPKGQMLVEIRSTGTYTLVEPSIHPSGESIAWAEFGEPAVLAVADLRRAVALLATTTAIATTWPATNGSRHDMSLAWAGFLLRGLGPDSVDTVEHVIRCAAGEARDEEVQDRVRAVIDTAKRLQGADATTGGPTLQELGVPEAVLKSISKWLGFKRKAKAAPPSGKDADKLIAIGKEHELFHDERGTEYARVPSKDGSATFRIRSKQYQAILRRGFTERQGRSARRMSVAEAIEELAARASTGSPRAVFVRVTQHGAAIYVDLGVETQRVVEIDADGWRFVTDPPVLFVRPSGLLALPEPLRGGDVFSLGRFVNVPEGGPQLLVLAWMVHSFRTDVACPVLILNGEQGTAKTTTALVLQRLLDPNAGELRTPPREARDFVVAAANARLMAFDNLSGIPGWQSDLLCRFVTGSGFGTRKLYTDDEEQLFAAKRAILLNGIDDLATRPDLADRSLLVGLPLIAPERRRDEEAFWSEFSAARPALLGAIYDLVATTLRELPSVRLTSAPRMADFARTGVAVARALGLPDQAFLEAYEENWQLVNANTVEADAVARALMEWIPRLKEVWSGTPSQLHHELAKTAFSTVDQSTWEWPKTSAVFGKRLHRVAEALRRQGYRIEFGRVGKGRERTVTIYPVLPADGGRQRTDESL